MAASIAAPRNGQSARAGRVYFMITTDFPQNSGGKSVVIIV